MNHIFHTFIYKKYNKMKNKVLIAGGAGFVGSHLCQNFKIQIVMFLYLIIILIFYPMTSIQLKIWNTGIKFY